VIFDLIYGGNSKSVAIGSLYYNLDRRPLDMDIYHDEAVDIMEFVKSMISDILDNTAISSYQFDYPQYINIAKVPSNDNKANITSLLNSIINTIETGINPSIVLPSNGVLAFADGTLQRTQSARMFTANDFLYNGTVVDDILPGDFLYDYTTSSIFIMIDSGFGYNQLLDLTVRG
jgi:hypothetical protein